MGLDDVASSESAFVVAAAAAIFSPRVRGVVRQGAVYGVAGALKAGDVIAGAARGAASGMRDGSSVAGSAASEPAAATAGESSTQPAPGRRSSRSSRARSAEQ